MDEKEVPTQTLTDFSTPAEVIGNYRTLEKIGEGGMGEVFRAEQIEPIRRIVALKLVKPGMDSRQVVARFESERQVLALMNHPHIAKVYDAGVSEQGRPFFVMEYVTGVPVTEYSDRQRLNTRERLLLFIDICRGIQHAHQKGIIHRDIKASNVLVTVQEDKPVPKIIDFGVAKALSRQLMDQAVFTEIGQLIGTPEYMSPEQADGAGLDIDTRADVYSLGVLLYEMIVGILPCDPAAIRKSGYEEMRRQVREKDPPKPSTRFTAPGFDPNAAADKRKTDVSTLTRELKGDLDWITMKAMARDRSDRYASVSEMAEDIQRHLRNEPVSAGPPSPVYRLKKYIRRHRVGVTAAGLIVLALLAGIIGTSLNLHRALQAEKNAGEEAATARRVSEFLENLFLVSDPGESRGKSVTALEILDRGLDTIETDLAGQPKIQSRLMETMGRVYRNMGLYDKSDPIFQKALTFAEEAHGEESLEVADILHQMGILYEALGKYDEAESAARKAMDIRIKLFGEHDLSVARSRNSLAILAFNRGRYTEGEDLLKTSLQVKEKHLGPLDPEVGNTLTNLGILYQTQNRLAEAEPYFVRALEISEKQLGDDHPDLGSSLNNLGSLYETLGRYDEAETCYTRTRTIWEKTLGLDHPDVGIVLHNLANLARSRKDYVAAEPLYLQSYAIWTQSLGENHVYVAISLRERANLYREMEKFKEAEALYRQALALFENIYGPVHLNIAITLENQAQLLLRIGRIPEAVEMQTRARTILEKME
ncbi:MAG: serine/threonine-protein kinase [Acidobacteriota bacterium]|nr:serine/threonine-protein kinase [Acidobacteriota bacterium]